MQTHAELDEAHRLETGRGSVQGTGVRTRDRDGDSEGTRSCSIRALTGNRAIYVLRNILKFDGFGLFPFLEDNILG